MARNLMPSFLPATRSTAVLQVIAVPFATGFNHLKIANEIYYKLERCQTAVFGPTNLPVYGVGHSMGSLMHVLIATQYPAQRAGMQYSSPPQQID